MTAKSEVRGGGDRRGQTRQLFVRNQERVCSLRPGKFRRQQRLCAPQRVRAPLLPFGKGRVAPRGHLCWRDITAARPTLVLPVTAPSQQRPTAARARWSADKEGSTRGCLFVTHALLSLSMTLASTSSMSMQVESPSVPKRMMTTRSSSLRMAWSTSQPLLRWGIK